MCPNGSMAHVFSSSQVRVDWESSSAYEDDSIDHPVTPDGQEISGSGRNLI